MTNSYVLGLDIGITSVGWGIIDKQDNVIDCGVRLFEEADASNNATRREKRGARRVKRRRQQRVLEMRRLLLKEGVIDALHFKPLKNPYDIRVKGLSHALSNDEIATALLNITKRRGSTLDVEDLLEEESEDEKNAKVTLANNTKEIIESGKHVCEIQRDRFNETGVVRGHQNIFKSEDYAKEARAMLEHQSLGESFIEQAVDLITRKRHYSEGPGSHESPTPYGRFRVDEDTGEITEVNLIEEMRGRCSVYPDEFRAPLKSFSAELFNFLNDLNNLRIAGAQSHLTVDQKNLLIEEIRKKGYLSPKKDPAKAIGKLLDINPELISGFRQDSKGNPIITEFLGYQQFLKAFKPLNASIDSYMDRIDEIAEVLTSNKLPSERKKAFGNLKLDTAVSEGLAEMTKFEKYHSLSLKAIGEITEELLITNKNQMEIITESNMVQETVPTRLSIDENAILSPVAKRAHRQALLVVEALQEKYGYFDSIVVETTRAKNSADEKKAIQDAQSRNKERKKEAEQLVENEYGDIISQRLSGTKKLKIRLYKEQNGQCAYTYNSLDLRRIVEGDDPYEIEHIIPYSVSMDNSYHNKVLVEHKANQIKGQKTPFGYFKSGQAYGTIQTYEAFKREVLQNNNYSRKKKDNLLNEEDITKFDNLEEFTARNLVDTSYAVRSLMSSMRKFYKGHAIPTKIFTIRGHVTNLFRNIGMNELYKDNPSIESIEDNPLFKDRGQYHHHAIDALIAARLSEQKLVKNLMKVHRSEKLNKETGEIVQDTTPLEDGKLIRFVKSLADFDPGQYRFSWKVDKKPNRQFSDETIYSTRNYEDKEFVIKKYKDIYDLDNKKLESVLFDKKEDLLVYKNDPKTFELLQQAYQQYAHEKKPFQAYMEEHGDLRKYSKKGNGPAITQLKYTDGKLGSHMDISHKYSAKDKKVVLQQITPYRTDFYKSPEGRIKFVTIRRAELRPKEAKDGTKYYSIDQNLYDKKLKEKDIAPEAEFLHTFNRNEIIELTFNNKGTITKEQWRFIVTNDDKANVIEVKPIENVSEKPQIRKSISDKVTNVEKIAVSPIGEKQKVNHEPLKLRV